VLATDTTYVLAIAGADEDANATGDLDVTAGGPLRIEGSGSTIDADGIDRVIHVLASGELTVDGVTITGGDRPRTSMDDLTGSGGGILDQGAAELYDSFVTGNTSEPDGAGIAHLGTALRVERSTISDNPGADFTGQGSGIYNDGDGAVLVNSTISGNNGGLVGGVANMYGRFLTIVNCTITGNRVNPAANTATSSTSVPSRSSTR